MFLEVYNWFHANYLDSFSFFLSKIYWTVWFQILHIPLIIRASFAGDLQSVSWLAMALGGICGNLSGGYALINIDIDTIFLLFSILPSLQLLSCFLVEENSVDNKVLPEFSNSESSHGLNGNNIILDEDSFFEKKSKHSTSRRKKSQKDNKKKAAITTKLQTLEKVDPLASRWFHSLKAATYSLCRTFRQPIIFR